MNFGGWFLRDANWWIDYRRSVAQLLLMWERDQGGSDTRIDAAPPTLRMQSRGCIVVVNQLSECLSLVRL